MRAAVGFGPTERVDLDVTRGCVWLAVDRPPLRHRVVAPLGRVALCHSRPCLRPLSHAARIAFYACAALALAGCASGLTVPKETAVAVRVPCIDPNDRPARPELLTDGEILALDSYRATWALWGDRLDRQAYERKLEAVVEGCSRLPTVMP